MAPSPTGELHIGGLRTALYNYAWAKKNHGQFILRIEDTDRARLVAGAGERILKTFQNYGLVWDEGPYIQSERLEIYKNHAQDLVNSGHAYYCYCSKERLEKLRPKYDRHCRDLPKQEDVPHVVRLKIPDDQEISFEDIVMGKITVNSDTLDDQILLKSDDFPTYHLAVVVDDHLMEISHVIRANEWIPSTPKHVLLYQAFGWQLPIFAHLSVFLDPEGDGKMSKRRGAVSAQSFLESGYLPEAMLNYLMLLGWNPGTDQELFTLEEFTAAFDLKDLNKSNQKFTHDKLNWFNQQYIRKDPGLAEKLTKFTTRDEEEIKKVLPLIKDRLVTLKDFDELTQFFWERPKVTTDKPEIVDHARNILEKSWDGKVLEEKARQYCAQNNIKVGDYFMALRVAITGKMATPPLWDIMQVLGKEETLARLHEH